MAATEISRSHRERIRHAKAVRRCPSTNRQIDLAYDTYGDPSDGDPVIFVPGLNCNYLMHGEELIEAVHWGGVPNDTTTDAKHFVIRVDNRDSGNATRFDDVGRPNVYQYLLPRAAWPLLPPPPYRLSDMADDVIGLMDHLNISQAHLVGTSMGGMIAQLATIRHPERVLSLCSLASSCGNHSLPDPTWYAKLQVLKSPGSDASMEEVIQFKTDWAINVGCNHNRDEMRRLWRAKVEQWVRICEELHCEVAAGCEHGAGSDRQLAALLTAENREQGLRERVRCPTMVMHGRHDIVLPLPHGERTAAALGPSCRFLLQEHLGHCIITPEDALMLAREICVTTRMGSKFFGLAGRALSRRI